MIWRHLLWAVVAVLVATQPLAAEEEIPDPMAFIGRNLLVNPGAEDGLKGWVVTPDTYGRGKKAPKEGKYYFAPGPNKSTAEAVQEIDLGFVSELNIAQQPKCVIRGYMRDFEGKDESQIVVQFIGDKGQVYKRVKSKKIRSYPKWVLFEETLPLPRQASKVRFTLISKYRHGVHNNDGYFDDLYFGLTFK